jgi:hypothetical protein
MAWESPIRARSPSPPSLTPTIAPQTGGLVLGFGGSF